MKIYIDFKCSCGYPKCDKLRVVTVRENMVDFGFISHGKKRPEHGVVIEGKDWKKLIKFLTGIDK